MFSFKEGGPRKGSAAFFCMAVSMPNQFNCQPVASEQAGGAFCLVRALVRESVADGTTDKGTDTFFSSVNRID